MCDLKIARVFPRRTNATPTDELSFFGVPGLFTPEVDEVHISVTFTYDLPHAEYLAEQWKGVAPVRIGGPATGMRGEEFEPGMYLKPGYVITSRGCNNKCWFCSVPKREGKIRELTIKEGNNILDDNLLQCSDTHIKEVCYMLECQKEVQFTGGLEAKELLKRPWIVERLKKTKPQQMFFAYDTTDDYEPLKEASVILKDHGFTRHQMRCYVLCGWRRDTLHAAETRMKQCIRLGFFPQAMLYRDKNGDIDQNWTKFHRAWSRPAIINSMAKL